MKKLFSLILVALISSQMWGGYIKVTLNGTGYSSVSKVTCYRSTADNSAASITSSVGTVNSPSSNYVTVYSGDAYAKKVYCMTIELKNSNYYVDSWSCTWTKKNSVSEVASASGTTYYAEGNKIYFKTASSNSSFTCSATIKSTVTTYKVRFNANGGSGSMSDQNFTYGTAQNLTSNGFTAPTGKHFAGWATTSNGSVEYSNGQSVNNLTATDNGTVNLYAVWQYNTYTVVFNKNDNDATGTMTNQSFTYGTAQNLKSNGFTAPTEKHFEGWATTANGSVTYTNGQNVNNLTTTNNGTVNLYAKWAVNTYLIRFLMDDGETVIDSRNVAYGNKPTAPADEDVTKIADESYTYAFAGWDANNDGIVDEVANVTGAQDYVAVFTATPIVVVPTYNITVGAYSNGTVTLTAGGDVQVVPAEGGVYNYLEGTTIIVKATANRGFHFTEWSDHTTNPSVRVREIDGNKTFTPTFAANTPFTMYDTWTEADCMSNYDFTNTLTVVLDGRTFTADQWATLSVPFTTTLTADDALYNMVYRLSVATLSQDGGSMHFEFVRTNAIEANEPYLIVPRQAVNEVVFYGVKLETPVEKHPTTDNRVEFVSSLWKQTIHGRNEFYVGANSTLRYASTTGTTVKGNRAFFRKINDAASAPRRVVISIDGVETTKVLTEDGELVDTTTKRMENGILIIERNGVRYDAQGNLID